MVKLQKSRRQSLATMHSHEVQHKSLAVVHKVKSKWLRCSHKEATTKAGSLSISDNFTAEKAKTTSTSEKTTRAYVQKLSKRQRVKSTLRRWFGPSKPSNESVLATRTQNAEAETREATALIPRRNFSRIEILPAFEEYFSRSTVRLLSRTSAGFARTWRPLRTHLPPRNQAGQRGTHNNARGERQECRTHKQRDNSLALVLDRNSGHIRNVSDTSTLVDSREEPNHDPSKRLDTRKAEAQRSSPVDRLVEREIVLFEVLLKHGDKKLLSDRPSPKNLVNRLKTIRIAAIAQYTWACRKITSQAAAVMHLGQNIAQLQEKLNQQIQISNHYIQYSTLLTTQNAWLQHDSAARLQQETEQSSALQRELREKEQLWRDTLARCQEEKATLQSNLEDANEQLDRVPLTLQLLQDNVQTFETGMNAAIEREEAAKAEIEMLKIALWHKTQQFQESERTLKVSQKLHQKESLRVQELSDALKETCAQNGTDTRVAAARINEIEAQSIANEDTRNLVSHQNAMLRKAFEDSFLESQSRGIQRDFQPLLDLNKQQEDLTVYLQAELSLFKAAGISAKEVKSRIAKEREQETLVSKLRAANKTLEDKLLAEEMQNATYVSQLQEAKDYFLGIEQQLEDANEAISIVKADNQNWATAMTDMLHTDMSKQHLVRAEHWVVHRLQAEIQAKDNRIEELTTDVESLRDENVRIQNVCTMNLDFTREQAECERMLMGNTIIFAETNYRERNEAYAKLRAFEKRFAEELVAEPLVLENNFVAPFDEVAPVDFKEHLEAAWKWAYPSDEDNEPIADINEKPWFNMTPYDLARLRVFYGLPPSDILTIETAAVTADLETETGSIGIAV